MRAPESSRRAPTQPPGAASTKRVKGVERYGGDGVGFVFSESDPYAGVDLDDCIDQKNELGRTAHEIVASFDTYTEVSPSGEGLHCILRGTVPTGARKQAVLDGQKVEVYSQGRFFCMTGASIANGMPIGDRQPQLNALCKRLAEAARKAKRHGGAPLREGEGRNNELIRLLGIEVAKSVTGEALARRAHELNGDGRFDPPLDDDEVESCLRHAGQWEPGAAAYHLTELGNAERFAAQHAGHARVPRGRACSPTTRAVASTSPTTPSWCAMPKRRCAASTARPPRTSTRRRARRSPPTRNAASPRRRSTPCWRWPQPRRHWRLTSAEFDADPELLNCTQWRGEPAQRRSACRTRPTTA